MAYNKDEIFQQANIAIVSNNLFFIEDVVAFLPCDKTTFYRFFPPESNEYNALKSLLDGNKVRTKSSIRGKLYKGKGSDLIALYKMICTDDERRALSMSYVEGKHDIDAKGAVFVLPDDETKKALERIVNDGKRD